MDGRSHAFDSLFGDQLGLDAQIRKTHSSTFLRVQLAHAEFKAYFEFYNHNKATIRIENFIEQQALVLLLTTGVPWFKNN